MGGKKDDKKNDDKKDEKKEEKKEEKKVDPLDVLPPSKFNLDEFKGFFVNHADKKEAIKTFWKDFDAEGYSIYHLHYEMYEGEGVKMTLTNNLCNGFL
jgi:elongation factor 1-gamma